MSIPQILDQLLRHDLPRSLQILAPELVLCGVVIVLLLIRLFDLQRRLPSQTVALLGALAAFLGVFAQFMFAKVGADHAPLQALYEVWGVTQTGIGTAGPYFTGLLMHDQFGVFFRLGLSLFLVLMIALTVLSGIPDQEDGQDFYTLLIGATVGMMLATTANHLLMLFIAVEMMSVPSYALVAFQKGRRQAGEAALKYVVYGAGAAGVMLYGLSLVAGVLGTASFPLMAERAVLVLGSSGLQPQDATTVTLVFGILMVLVGLAFKLSLAPFHFWCPDAFEGASAEVAGFLSVASKAAAFALMVRFVLAFSGSGESLRELGMLFGLGLGVISIITMTYGNLAAYTQNNLKRMLAYSTIAHAGYMVMAVAAMLVILNAPMGHRLDIEAEATKAIEGLTYYLAVYLFMNLTAFACIALLRNEIFREDVEGYAGLFQGNGATKLLCVCLALSFFSLVGLPPFGGFFAKMMIFNAAFRAGSVHWLMWLVLAMGGLNTVFSLFYYLRVMKAVFITPPATERRPLQLSGLVGAYVALVAAPILVLGASPLMSDLSATAEYVAASLFR